MLLVSSAAAFAATPFAPTTTLAAETGNNTSAAASFTTQSNGNIGGANISKVPMRSLLYPGSTAKIYAHFVPWFGFGDHMNVGYTSNDVAQVQKQVADMLSRGFDGVVIDWYGRGTLNHNFVFYDQATQDIMHEAEAHPGFTFAVMEDVGAIKQCATTAGCNYTQMMIDDLNYANTTYWNSPAYLHYNGRPVVYFFGEEAYTIDWNLVRNSVAGNPEFIFRNPGGFNYPQANGGYSWVEPTTTGMTYLDGYYAAALTFPTEYSTGSAYKGFNDNLAAWTQHRVTAQSCGQTWLTSVAEAGKYYSAAKQMFGIQLVTWNDYEEGTEIETGIDNCVAVNASISGSTVSWTITGQMNTVDHFSVYASQDGQNLMWLADEATTVTSVDLAQFGLPAGNYTVFVKAVGKPSMTNKMSNGTQVTLAAGAPAPAPSPTPTPSGNAISISAPSGATATIKAGQTATFSLQVAANGAPATVTVTCAGAPPKGACNVPSTAFSVTPGTPAPVSVSVSTTANAGGVPAPSSKNAPPRGLLPVVSVFSMATLLAFFFGGKQPIQLGKQWLSASKESLSGLNRGFSAGPKDGTFPLWARLIANCQLLIAGGRPFAFAAPMVLLAGLALTGCGGSVQKSPNSPTPPYNGTPINTYTLTVTATSGSTTQSQQLTLTVQ
jgi:hypothetical protein